MTSSTRIRAEHADAGSADDEMFRDRFRRDVESARRVRRFCSDTLFGDVDASSIG